LAKTNSWAKAFTLILLVQPSSVAAESVFAFTELF